MSSPRGDFSRALRTLDGYGGRRPLALAVVVSLTLLAWGAWFLLARVDVYAVSATARLEADRAAHPVASPVVARVAEVRLAVGQQVEQGEILVRLEDDAERHRLEEASTLARALASQLETLRREQGLSRRNLEQRVESLRAAAAESAERLRVAEADARLAASDLQRVGQLDGSGLVAGADLERARARVDGLQAEVQALAAARTRSGWELEVGESQRRAGEEGMQRELARLSGDEAAARETVARCAAELAKLTLRSPVAGTVGEAADLRPGNVLQEGDRVAVVVPRGQLRVVAQFEPAAALGRVRPGQPARLRLYGFPWAEFGSLEARVTGVASDLRDGLLRVELALQPNAGSRIPLQHGLPGVVEVVVERLSPAGLSLRAAGKRLGFDPPAPAVTAASGAGS